ncbi:MAG: hypothetical protein J6U95_07265 [Alistipes sp.]|nr:hypothetical protein [Alistipes sp.]
MKILQILASAATLVATMTACSNEVESTTPIAPEENYQEACFALDIDQSRTTIAPDGRSTHWCEGDNIAVWAKRTNGEYAFMGERFLLRYFSTEWDKAFFVGNIPAMSEEEYTYYISSPRPDKVEGTMATYNVAAEQSGEYDGKYDIMVGEPTVNGSLTTGKRTELNTIMRHQMHAIKITVPEGRNLYGTKFDYLEITFPQDVVGDITLDVTNPQAEPIYSNTSNVVTVSNAKGFDAGDDIWIFVLPGIITGDVSYQVRGGRRPSEVATYALSRTMQAGHVTPIRMMIPVIDPHYTALHISIDQNNLGEEFNYFDVYDTNNTHMGRFERNASNKYTVDYIGEFNADIYDYTNWRVVFDSEHAIVQTIINLGDMTSYTEHTCWVNVPYLFSENFSSITSYERDSNTGAQGTTVTAYDLSSSSYGLSSGWSGARTGGEAGKSIRVGSRVDRVFGYSHTYGRLDSPTLNGLKPGAIVKVKVSFNYSGGRNGDSGYSPRAVCGYTETQGLINGTTGSFTSDEDNWNNIDGATLIPSISTSGSYSSVGQSMSYTIATCKSTYRLSWQIRGTGDGAGISNGNQWLYIDNVKVQIVK